MTEEMAMQYQRGYIDGFKDGKATLDPKTGHWIWRTKDVYTDIYRCSECHEDIHVYIIDNPRYKFCPICGIKMIEPQERSEE